MEITLKILENQKIKFSLLEPTLKKSEKKNHTANQKKICIELFFTISILVLFILQINYFFILFEKNIDEIHF